MKVEWDKRDRYGRIVGKVWVQPVSCPTCPMTLDVGHAQITVGLAWWYRRVRRLSSRPRTRALASSPNKRHGPNGWGCGARRTRCHRGSRAATGRCQTVGLRRDWCRFLRAFGDSQFGQSRQSPLGQFCPLYTHHRTLARLDLSNDCFDYDHGQVPTQPVRSCAVVRPLPSVEPTLDQAMQEGGPRPTVTMTARRLAPCRLSDLRSCTRPRHSADGRVAR
ncbi:MAG: hypothetical protein MZV70_01795 [Desulfobacterales bacterium]|nr:hypothetical protein [Desulfobacterales bacterium]